MTTKTEIVVTTRQRITLRRGGWIDNWCELCAARVRMLTPDEAAAFAQTTARAIFRSIEAGHLHFIETESGELLVCSNSLAFKALV